MLQVDRILYPTDFSATADRALAYALELVVTFNAELHVLHVRSGDPRSAVTADGTEPVEVDLDIRLREMVNARLGRIDAPVRERMRIEYSLGYDVTPAPAIIRYVDSHGIDLVVIGTHGRRGVRRLLLGSVTTEVLHGCRCAVMTVSGAIDSLPPRPSGWRLLAPVDLTGGSVSALVEAGALADRLHAQLTLLHVLEPPPLPVFSVGKSGMFGTLIPNLRHAALDRLQRLREEAGLPEQTRLFVDEGPPAMIITDVAENQNIDLIVMAASGRKEGQRSLLGSVTERVVRRVTCPVWVLEARDVSAAEGGAPAALSASDAASGGQ